MSNFINHLSLIICILLFNFKLSSPTIQINPIMNIPTLTSEFERFDLSKFDRKVEINKISKPGGIYIESEKLDDGYTERIYQENSCFFILKNYYANCNIKEKGVLFNSGYFKIGNWYSFSAGGQLAKTYNDENIFTFNFEKLYDFITKERIGLSFGFIHDYTGFHTVIQKKIDINNNPLWVINWQKEPQIIEEISISGSSGKVLSRVKEFIEEN